MNSNLKNSLYVLEVQKWIQEPLEEKGFIHVGYMDKVFTSKLEAIQYYDSHIEKDEDGKDKMRSINVFANCCSDWDPNTYLRYIVHRYFGEKKTIPPFEDNL